MKTDFLYLASQSPRRSQLLDQIGVRHTLLLPDATEDAEALEAVLQGESPTAYVQRVTELKWRVAVERHRQRGLAAGPILCADTTVALGRRILGKPTDAAQATQMLSDLSGREHRVLTAVVVGKGRYMRSALSVSRVRFDPLSAAWIKAYVASGEPMGKAGAYAIQGRAAGRVASISGSYSGIMGLPLRETAQLIEDWVQLT
jgi:septum formation protein